jgi:hypothetical protein
MTINPGRNILNFPSPPPSPQRGEGGGEGKSVRRKFSDLHKGNLNRFMLRIDDEEMIFWLKNGPGFDDIGIKSRSHGGFAFERIIIYSIQAKPRIESP